MHYLSEYWHWVAAVGGPLLFFGVVWPLLKLHRRRPRSQASLEPTKDFQPTMLLISFERALTRLGFYVEVDPVIGTSYARFQDRPVISGLTCDETGLRYTIWPGTSPGILALVDQAVAAAQTEEW